MVNSLQRWILRLAPPIVLLFGLTSLVAIFFWVPSDRVLGLSQRIFYWHVPSAVACLLAFGIAGVSSIFYLWTRHSDWDHAAHAGVSVGMLFGTIVLATGSIWAHTAWGAWWTWDALLSFFLVMWLVYASYLLLRTFARENDMAPRYAAVLAIVGTLNAALVWMATTMFRTIHPRVIRNPEGGIDNSSMVTTLMLSFVAFLALVLWLWAVKLVQLRAAHRLDLIEGERNA